MGLTALVMAGGKGIRMNLKKEKPMIKVGNKPVILHVLEALRKSKKISEIVVAVSKYTPKTAKFVKKLRISCITTPGKDYVYDMRYAINLLRPSKALIISADIPLINEEIIDDTVQHFEKCNKPAMTVAVPLEIYEKLGITADHIFEVNGIRVAPVGLNLLDGMQIMKTASELPEEVLIVSREELAVNVNTVHDLMVARRRFNKLQRNKARQAERILIRKIRT